MIYTACHRYDVFVSLTDVEIDEALEFGRQMYHLSQCRGLHDHRTFVRRGVNGERVQSIGSLAERAGAKALGLPWTHWIDTFKSPDLHHNIEVRLIGVDHYGLRIYDRDDDSRRVVGVVIERGAEHSVYRIPGWINAKYAKRPEYLIDPLNRGQPMYAVPQDRLRSLKELEELIAGER